MYQDQTCSKCGALMKRSQRTGKLYCSALCWKNQESNFERAIPQPKGTGETILLEELRDFRKEMNERLDNMGKYFALKDKK